MKKKKHARLVLLAASAISGGAVGSVSAQSLPPTGDPSPVGLSLGSSTSARLGISGAADGWFPKTLDADSDVAFAIGSTAQLTFAALPFLEALGRAGVYSMTLDSNDSVLYIGGAAGLGYVARLFERVSVGVSAWAGLGKVPYQGQSLGLYELGARLETSFRLTAAMSLGVSAGYEHLANPYTGSFLDAISAGLRLKLAPAELRQDRVNLAFKKIETQAIFPVFRSWYDAEPLGTVTIRNDEDSAIENVRVSFFAPEYMGGPRLCQVVPRVERGATVTVPLYAVFDERILTLTENGATSAEIDVDYTFLGAQRAAKEGLTLSLHHRNAMSWEDDRRAAAFVSPTDPAALWFSRYASSIVRDRMRTELPANLQFALGIFESLKLYGLNYVIDPNSSYIEMSENAAVVDYLQYPSQTLMYRGGDCDDLSILYSSLLESSGIATAFITIPGHIFMAFDLGLGEAEARDQFFDPGLLIFRDGKAWAPIEITMVKEGFVKAWRVGAKQWIDNDKAGSAAFYPMKENWVRYKPSGLQDAAARFNLPDEAKAMAAFDSGVDRFVSRELEPIIAEYEKKLANGRNPEILNEYGMAMARVGMLDPAWERFSEAAKAGYAWSWNNLASIAFVRKDYKLAYQYYAWTTTLLPGDPVAVLGMARSAYELDRFSESTILYSGLKIEAPVLAKRFGYLASAYGGSGRAWSMADRLSSSVWSKPGLDFSEPVPVTAPSIAAAPPPAPESAKAPEPVAAPPADIVAAPGPEPDPATAIAIEPSAELEPAAELIASPEPEPAPVPVLETPPVEPAPATELVAAPEPEPVPVPVVVTPPAELPPAVAVAVAVAPKPAPVVAVPTTAPPSVIDKPPEDADIATKAADALIAPPPVLAPPPVPEPAPRPLGFVEVPAVTAPPADVEIAAKALEPEPVTVPTPIVAEPAPVTAPKPVVAGPAAVVELAKVVTPAEEPAEPVPVIVQSPEPTLHAPAARYTRTVDLGGAPAFGKRLPDDADASGYERVVVSAPEPTHPVLDLGAAGIRVASGSWSRKDTSAAMTDPKSMYAKLVIPTPGFQGPVAYEFKARAEGTGWVGFGIHIHGKGTWKMSSYGGGDSLLVWITSDPKTFGDATPHLQVYRSYGEVAMKNLASVRLEGSAFDLRDYRIEYDPVAGTLAVLVDGVSSLEIAQLKDSPESDYIALRALDLAEFSDIRISPMNAGAAGAETTP